MTRQATLVLVVAITLGALARFATLDLQSLHHDEALTASRALQPGLWDMLNEVVDGERNPPLYFVLAWIWSQIFGAGEIGLRSLSALLGTFMIPAAFFAGRELSGARAGVVAAALVALNPLLVWYSQEARAYVLMALLITLSLAFLARSLSQPSRTNLTLWAVTCALALSTHYFAIFLVAPQALWLLYHSSANRRTVAACGAIVATVLALVPLAATQQGEDRREGFRDLSLPGRVAEVALDYSSSEDPDPLSGSSRVDAVQVIAGLGGGLLIVGGLALALTMGSHRERRACLLVAGIGLFGVGIPALAAAVGFDFLKPRNVMAGVVPLLLGAAIGFATRERPRLGLGGAVALCVLYSGVIVAVNSTAEMQREDWRRVAELIGDHTGPRLLAVPQNGDDPLIYYLDAERFVGPTAKDGITTRQVVAVSTTDAITPPAGFEIVRQDRLPPLFTVRTLQADRPKQLYPGDVASTLKERSTFLVESG